MKLKLKLFILIFIFIITISLNNVVFGDDFYRCDALVTDEFFDSGKLANLIFGYGGDSLETIRNRNTGTNAYFYEVWVFLIDGVDIDKIKEYGLEDQYKSFLEEMLGAMENVAIAEAKGWDFQSISEDFELNDSNIDQEKKKAREKLKAVGASDEEIEDGMESFDDVENIEDAMETGDQNKIDDAVADSVENNQEYDGDKNNKIFKQPQATDVTTSTTDSIEGIVSDGEKFLDSGANPNEFESINAENIKSFSNTIYNILLTVGVVVAVAVGGIIGIKLMTASASEKADVKQYILPYVIGCIVVFGAFGLWKLVVTILQGIEI